MTIITDGENASVDSFLRAVFRAADRIGAGETEYFICPFCGGEAFVSKSAKVGGEFARCDDCGSSVVW